MVHVIGEGPEGMGPVWSWLPLGPCETRLRKTRGLLGRNVPLSCCDVLQAEAAETSHTRRFSGPNHARLR